MKSLQNKIFLFFVLLLLMVQAIAFWTLYSGNKNQEAAEINNRLNTAKTIFTELFDNRLDYLAVFAKTVAKDSGLQEVFTDDTRSLLVAMNNHRKRINADLVMAISVDNIITGQLQRQHIPSNDDSSRKYKVRKGKEQGQQFRFPSWLESQQPAHLYMIDDSLYQFSLSPVIVGAKTIGWLAFGFQIDQLLAKEFMNITDFQTDFILKEKGSWRLIASSNDENFNNQLTRTKALKFAQQIIQGNTPEKYIATHSLITEFDQQELGVAMYGLRANFTALLQEQWWKLLILTALTLFLSLTSAYLIAASISKPIKRLAAQAKIVAHGDYHQKVTLNDKSELGQLADEFNQMQVAVLSREKAITHLANHDPLTNLPNRNILNKTLEQLIAAQQTFSLLHLNLSRLKDVNDTLGHDVGDQVIKELAHRLTILTDNQVPSLKKTSTAIQLLVHLGADEFIFLTTQGNYQEAIALISTQLENNFDYQGTSLQLQVRIGIALYPKHSSTAKVLVQMADTALHHTRNTGKLMQLYHPDFDVNTVERLNLINDLKQAIPAGELTLHFQPKLCLRTNVVTHVEALVRWEHPSLGMVPPDDFIHIAEQTGQIKALTRWVFTTALTQSTLWRELGIEVNIAVNISAENLKEIDFHDFICNELERINVPANKVTLEVTESAVVDDPESAITLLSKFKDHGMHISIDDYGTGYSSLAQLKQLPVHELKIDKSFIQRLEHDEDDQIIVRSTIELAHNMGLSVVAEGIEDEFSLNWLIQHKCELAQGYFISRPQPANRLTSWLLEQQVKARKINEPNA